MQIKTTYPSQPIAAVGAFVWNADEELLLVRRGRAPARGEWAIPGGRILLGESLQEAAEREIAEEAGIRIRAGRPIYSFDVIDRDEEGHVRHHYLVVDVLAEHISGVPVAGTDVTEARWFAKARLQDLVTQQDSELNQITAAALVDLGVCTLHPA